MRYLCAGGGRADEKSRPVQNEHNGKIDLLKFLFSIVIVLHHGKNVVGEGKYLFLSGGSFAVEFFFIVSGYLLMLSVRKRNAGPGNRIGTETRNFIVKKYKSFCPEIFVAYAVALLVYGSINNSDFLNLFITTFFEGALIKMTGLHIHSINSAVWYVSSMLICMAILYPFIRKYPDFSVKFFLPLSSLLVLGYFCGNGRSPRAPTEWMGWTYRGNLRAYAEISIGVCCYEYGEFLKTLDLTKVGKWLLSLIETVCYLLVFSYMYFNNSSRQDYFYIFLCAIAVIITFSGKTIDAGWYNNKLCYFLGKYSFCLYLSHSFYSTQLNAIFSDGMGRKERMLVYLFCSAITGFVVMIISNVIRKNKNAIVYKIRRAIVCDVKEI